VESFGIGRKGTELFAASRRLMLTRSHEVLHSARNSNNLFRNNDSSSMIA
jgi:hypothetical protein